MAMQSGCKVHMDGNETIVGGDSEIAKLDVEDWDIQSEYNVGTYKFTAEKAGKYLVIFHVTYEVTADGDSIFALIYVNDALAEYARVEASGLNKQTVAISTMFDIAATDTISFYYLNSDNNDTIDADNTFAVIQKIT